MRSLSDWLDQQQKSHPSAIDLDLTRVRSVAQRMQLLPPRYRVITVAGTNGKGSTVAYLDALFRGAGRRTGRFTSPHLVRYNERICIDGVEARDADLIAAFERIDAARASTTLTFFEYNALAALDLFARAAVDVAVLEVGLGGRLDATNIVDADVGVVCSIGLDHVDWLGDSLEQIGREKAGIFRPGRPAVLGLAPMPASVWKVIEELGALPVAPDQQYRVHAHDGGWATCRCPHWPAATRSAMRPRRWLRSPAAISISSSTTPRSAPRWPLCTSRVAFNACLARSNGFSMWPTTCRPPKRCVTICNTCRARAARWRSAASSVTRTSAGSRPDWRPTSMHGFSRGSRAHAR
jgi:hypothetical protein